MSVGEQADSHTLECRWQIDHGQVGTRDGELVTLIEETVPADARKARGAAAEQELQSGPPVHSRAHVLILAVSSVGLASDVRGPVEVLRYSTVLSATS